MYVSTRHSRITTFGVLLTGILATLLSTGCSLPFGKSGDLSELATEAPPSCIVEIHPQSGKPKQETVLLEAGMTVQSALDKTKCSRRFKEMDILVVRAPNQQVPRTHRLEATWDAEKRQVAIESDYALYPGDVLIVSQSEKSFTEKALGDVLRPLNSMTR